MEPHVLELILNGRNEPTNIRLSLLQNITDNFSMERLIGQGSFGAVYKGVLPNMTVAVKRFYSSFTISDKLFYHEVNHMLDVDHENVVRFLGYCGNMEEVAITTGGSNERVYGEIKEQLLCFEYCSNGGLHNHITDELRGLEWDTRYQIIKQISAGLNYLHNEKRIIHMSLKPSNIVLDNRMMPKIMDFSQSRLCEESRMFTSTRMGTRGYTDPKFLLTGQMSYKSDMYSLGVIIIELVTGQKRFSSTNNVLRRWGHRWRKSGKGKPLSYQQVTKCIEIGILCQEEDPYKRPFIGDVIHDFNVMDVTNGKISNAYQHIDPYSQDDMLGIEPLELHFHFEPNKETSSSLELTNDTKICIAFMIKTKCRLRYCIDPNKGIMPPQSKCIVKITLQSQEKAPEHIHQANVFILQSTKVKNGFAAEDITADTFEAEAGNMVDEVNLDVVFNIKLESEHLDVQKLELHFPFEPDNLNPVVLTQDFLKAITCNFCTNSELGRGGYGVVYKGVFPSGEIIAVKKLFEIHPVEDDQFRDEIGHLTRIKHRNVVQTLGYCAETPIRLICLEYVPNKSLDKYITDESLGLEWDLRYKIIQGICQGLHFLHEEYHIVHLDLKPQNILMDAAMVPKITDFGLSKIFGEQQARLTSTDSRAGSPGYMAPEYLIQGLITVKADIFSLGVIIIQIITGRKEYPLSTTSFEVYTEKVVGSWRKKFASTPKYKSSDKYTQQVKQCVAIALNCVNPCMEKRPSAKNIIQVLTGLDWEGLSPTPELSRGGEGIQ